MRTTCAVILLGILSMYNMLAISGYSSAFASINKPLLFNCHSKPVTVSQPKPT